MFLSVFDVFKIGIGPSSSHTMGPMTAASRFLATLREHPSREMIQRIQVRLYGSLAFTGRGHATDRAVTLGLLGYTPAELDITAAERQIAELQKTATIRIQGLPPLLFDPKVDIVFDYGPALPGHANGMIFQAWGNSGEVIFSETYYSIGGGFVISAEEQEPTSQITQPTGQWPYPFQSAAAMLAMANASGLSISQMKRRNEETSRSPAEIRDGLSLIWKTMSDCIDRGMTNKGELPGGLNVKRRAARLLQQMRQEQTSNRLQPHAATDWLYLYAMAVNEENAAGGKVVTAPTNGAAGVVPAVIRYYIDHCVGAEPDKIHDFLLTAAAIGGLIKYNASISGAEAGCQGEVGSAAAMAAAGLCEVLGGTPAQVENAAEIALEHHLGMTCDPVGGLVQVPCIERNGIAASKAVTAASLALRGDGSHFMPLDNCISAMRQTGEAMNTKFKETSLGGLAVNLPEC